MSPIARSATVVAVAAAALATPVGAQPPAPDIVVTRVINAPVEEGWKAWTTAAGAKHKAYFESAWPAVVGNLERKYAAK